MPAPIVGLPELQYCPALKVAFVGAPGAKLHGHASIPMAEHKAQIAEAADSAKEYAGEKAAIPVPAEAEHASAA